METGTRSHGLSIVGRKLSSRVIKDCFDITEEYIGEGKFERSLGDIIEDSLHAYEGAAVIGIYRSIHLALERLT